MSKKVIFQVIDDPDGKKDETLDFFLSKRLYDGAIMVCAKWRGQSWNLIRFTPDGRVGAHCGLPDDFPLKNDVETGQLLLF